ncbi:MAG: response regulator transcription factor [Planctomycetota bacterium]
MATNFASRTSNGESPTFPRRHTIRLACYFRRQLDAASFAALFRPMQGFVTVAVGTGLAEAEEMCRVTRPHAMLLDASYGAIAACDLAARLLTRELASGVLLLDDEIRVARVDCALKITRCGYFTRNSTADEVCDGVRELLCGNVAVDRQIAPAGVRGHRALKDAVRRLDDHGFLRLSARERQVMRMLALGKTAPQIGEALGLQVSTVDNHRTRVMKKLGVHKAPRLTQIAMQVGLIE